MTDTPEPIVRRKKKVFVVQGTKIQSSAVSPKAKPTPKTSVKPAERTKASEEKTEEKVKAPPPVAKQTDEPLSPSDKQKRKAKKNASQNQKYLKRVKERWPALFCDPPKPLAIGILKDLFKELEDGEGKTWVRRGIAIWCQSAPYLKVLVEGGPRYGLQGESGEVTQKQQEYASSKLQKP